MPGSSATYADEERGREVSGGLVRIDFNYEKERKKFEGIEKEQFPFAVALALTRTAIQAQKVVQKETQERFNLHTMFIPRKIGRAHV